MYLKTMIKPGDKINLTPISQTIKVKEILSVEFELKDSNIESVEVDFRDEGGNLRTMQTTFMSEAQIYMVEVW